MSRRWKIVLGLSLVLNLFLAGAGVGVLVSLRSERVEFRRGGDNQRVSAAFQTLPPDRRHALQDILRGQALVAAEDLRVARGERRQAMQLMAAETYDAGAVSAALARARDADGRARARIDATLATRLAELSPQERAMFSRMLMRGPGRGGGRPARGEGRRGGLGPAPIEGSPAPPPAAVKAP